MYNVKTIVYLGACSLQLNYILLGCQVSYSTGWLYCNMLLDKKKCLYQQNRGNARVMTLSLLSLSLSL